MTHEDDASVGDNESKDSTVELEQIKEKSVEIIEEIVLDKYDPSEYQLVDENIFQLRSQIKVLAKRNHNYFWTKKVCDGRDSENPSFSKLKSPYEQICRVRYAKASKIYDKQFFKELKNLEIQQGNASEMFRYTRVFSITSLWPPLHNRPDINRFTRSFFKHTPKDRERLLYLLDNIQE